jgi:hypothetical protein
MHNVTLRRVRVTLLQRKMNKYYIFVRLRARACARVHRRVHARA